jgi:putative ABC transport system permease protein
MSSRWKKVWADFWSNKTRTFLTILIILAGTFAVGFTVNLAAFMNESMDRDFLSARPSEAILYTSSATDKIVEIAGRVPGVDAVEGRSISQANIVQSDGKLVAIQFTAIDDPNTLIVDLLKPAKGEAKIHSLNDRQILADASLAALGYRPGDTIIVELSNGKQRKLKVAGYVHDVINPPYGMWSKTISAYVTPTTMEWLGGSRSFNRLLVSVDKDPTDRPHVVDIAQAVAGAVEDTGVTVAAVAVYLPGRHFSWQVDQGIFFLIGALSYMMVFLSVFLIINTITALMAQQTRQIGIMKAVGGGTGQIFGMYIALILIMGLAALLIAIPLAGWVAQIIGTGMAANLGFFTIPFKISSQALAQQAFVALLVPLLAGILPIYGSVRITVREALASYGIGASAKRRNKNINRPVLLIPRPMRLSLRNAFRRKIRLTLTLFSLIIGGSIFIGVSNIQASFNKLLDDLQGYVLADVNIYFDRFYRYEEVSTIVLDHPGVSGAEGWLDYPGSLIANENEKGTDILFIGLPKNSTLIDPLISQGRWLIPGDENAIVASNFFLNAHPETKVGDWLTIKIGDRETKWQIIGFYTTAVDTSTLFYVNYDYLSQITGRPEQVYSLRVPTRQHDPATQYRIADELRARFEARGIKVTTQTATETFASVHSIINILVSFMTVMAVLIALVGGLGLMGTMSINVIERTREIGVMRAVGASNGNIQAIVIVEGIIIGLISWAISILVSIPITAVVTYGVGKFVFNIPHLAPVYDATGIIIWLIFTVVMTLVSSALPARTASRLTVKDTLAYE